MSSSLPEEMPEPSKVVSPFAHTEAALPQKQEGGSHRLIFWIGLVLILMAVGLVAGVFMTRYLKDPYRTLERFPVSKYLDGYQALAGSKFKAELRVEADLGWNEKTGRLMLFSTPDDARPIAVMIPPAVGNGIYFTKGQSYLAEIEVKEGGLIYAGSCRKN